LNTVYRQIRAEFRPLFYGARKLVVHFGDLSKALECFYPLEDQNVTFTCMAVTVEQDDVHVIDLDLLPQLRAQTGKQSALQFELAGISREGDHFRMSKMQPYLSLVYLCEFFDNLARLTSDKLWDGVGVRGQEELKD
jgi:hypothetical protein